MKRQGRERSENCGCRTLGRRHKQGQRLKHRENTLEHLGSLWHTRHGALPSSAHYPAAGRAHASALQLKLGGIAVLRNVLCNRPEDICN